MSFWRRCLANATFCAEVILEKSGDPSDFFGTEPSPPKLGEGAGFGMTLAATTFPDVLGTCALAGFAASDTVLPVPA